MRAAGGILGGAELFEKAFAEIDKAIQHTPTIIELYIHKAKLYQRCGEPQLAYKLTEEARMLDQADRYLNAHSAKYAFKNNLVDKARDTMVLFSKDQDT